MITQGLNTVPGSWVTQGLNPIRLPSGQLPVSDTTVINYPPKFPPPAEKLPFGPSGKLLPNGPKWGAPWRADDIGQYIKRRQWLRRYSQDAWTNPIQRQLILAWLSSFFASGMWATWHIEERNTDDQSSLTFSRRPRIIITVTTKAKPTRTFKATVEFPDEVLESTARFNTALARAGAHLLQQAGS